MDRSTKATLSTYNTWIQLSRLQKIYHFQSLKFRLAAKALTLGAADTQQGRDLMLDMSQWKQIQHCLASMDSDLEAFSRNPTDGSFAVLAFQLAAFTKYLNEVFLSY